MTDIINKEYIQDLLNIMSNKRYVKTYMLCKNINNENLPVIIIKIVDECNVVNIHKDLDSFIRLSDELENIMNFDVTIDRIVYNIQQTDYQKEILINFLYILSKEKFTSESFSEENIERTEKIIKVINIMKNYKNLLDKSDIQDIKMTNFYISNIIDKWNLI